jgi:probable rRNA maturation factor
MHQRRRLSIRLAWEYPEPWRAVALLIRAARTAADAEKLREGELSIAVVDAAAMCGLHQQFTGKSGATDVLTFDLRGDPSDRRVDGQIVVCADVARQTVGGKPRRVDLRRELALYVVHGVLHLAGYDDHQPADFECMHRREDAILESLGLGRVFHEGPRGGVRGRGALKRSRL